MYYGKVEISGINTSKLRVLTEAEKTALLERVAKGDMKAREELINGNLRLVLSVIQKFTGRGESPDDLFQVGCIGLIKAIDNFSAEFGVRFSTYAVPMIEGEVKRHIRDSGQIRVSRSLRDTAYKAMQAKEQLTAELRRDPTIDEIAERVCCRREDVVIAFEAVSEPISLYEPVFSESGDTVYVMDQIGDNNDDNNWLDEIALKDAISALGSREKKILNLRFLQGKTQVEVADEIGISQAQVSRLEKSALCKIKNEI